MTQKSNKAPRPFTWFDVPRSIMYFLGENKARWVFFNTVLFIVLFYELVPTLIVGKIIDFFAGYTPGDPLDVFYGYALFLGIAHISVSFIRLTSKDNLSRIGIIARTQARVLGFEKLVSLPLHWHAEENMGNKIERVFTGSLALREWSHVINEKIFPIIVGFVGILSVFAFLSPVFLVYMLVYSFIFFSITFYFNRKVAALNDHYNSSNQKASGTYIESTSNILSIKALGSEKHLHGRVQKTEEAAREFQIKISNTGTHKWYFFQMLNGVSFTLFFLLLGHQILGGFITVGSILVFYAYFKQLRDAAYDVSESSNKIIGLKSDIANMMPVFLEDAAVPTGTDPFPEGWDAFRIRDGSFAYPSGQQALDAITLTIMKNEKLGIAGASGSGKSTLVKLMLGLYGLDSGSFTVGSKNYYDIAHDDLIKHVAVVLQETELFNLSLKDNITGLKDVDPELLALAIEVAQLKSVLEKLPEGLDTLVGEKGYKLSGGERQRLGIARAVCKDAPIILLDEATSALDSKTEKKIMDKFFSAFGDKKTFIVIAHRISTLKNTDRVVVFEKGGIAEEGIYSDLIANPASHLGQLHALQSKV